MDFNAENFMNAVFTDAMDDRRTPCPAGEYHAQIEKVEPRTGTIANGERAGQGWAALNISYSITDPAVLALVGRDKVTVFDMLMLDITPAGGLDVGPQKNVRLGALRSAVDQNTKGQPWSPAMLVGQMVKVMVKHVPGRRDPSDMVAEVSGVVRA